MIRDRIRSDLTQALKAGKRENADALRMVISSITLVEKESGSEANDEQVMGVLRKALKQRKEASEAFLKAGRQESAAKEDREAALISGYLPAEMDEAALRDKVQNLLSQAGASGPSDLGKAMGLAMKELRGQVDGSRVQKVVKELLGG